MWGKSRFVMLGALQGCSPGENGCRLPVLTSTPGLLLLTVKQCFHRRLLTAADLQDSHPRLPSLCVCEKVWVRRRLNKYNRESHPASVGEGGGVGKHAEYKPESNANQLLSYAACDLWWTLKRWMPPRPSIEISGPEQQEHISSEFSTPACYLWMNK